MRDKRFRPAGIALAIVASALLSGCGGGLFGSSAGSSSPSLGDRFGQIFGSKSQAVGTAAPATDDDDLTCPGVNIRAGTATLQVGLPGRPATGSDLRYQGSITRTARDCNLSGGQIRARVGVMGRIIIGPAGAPPTVDVPMRVAVVDESVPPKVIFSKAYRTTVAIPPGDINMEFSLVAEDVIYPVPPGGSTDSYVFYVGFDPEGLKPEPRAKKSRK